MYTLLYDHNNTSDSVVTLLKSICEITVVKTEDNWKIEEYKLKNCFPSKSFASYSLEYTKEEVERDFYMLVILPMVKRNGYTLFKKVTL